MATDPHGYSSRFRHYGYADARSLCIAADVFDEHGRFQYDIFMSTRVHDSAIPSMMHLYVWTTRSSYSMHEVWRKLDDLLPDVLWRVSFAHIS